MNQIQKVVFYDPLSQRMKMAKYLPIRDNDKYEKRRCHYLNRIYENLPDIGFFEYGPIVSKDNLLLGIGFMCPEVENKLWAKNLLDNCRNAVVDRLKDRTVAKFYWYFTETLEDLRERLPTLEEMEKRLPEGYPADLEYPMLPWSQFLSGIYVWKGVSEDGEPIEDAMLFFDDRIDRWPWLGFKLETENIPEPILKEERNEN